MSEAVGDLDGGPLPKGKRAKRTASSENGASTSASETKFTEDDLEIEFLSADPLGLERVHLKRSQSAISSEGHNEKKAKKAKLEKDLSSRQENVVCEDQKDQEEEKKKKPHHKRMKHTISCVLDQMEFYFGDSSLSKDRFLKAKVDSSPDGYVDLCVFAKFNKLQALHKDGVSHKVLIQALSHSKMLQLNEDKTKVRRITPFKEISQEETDKRTVYVEHLPSHASHTWVTQIFSQCGKVAYVSLPTYKSSKQIKGFAFVEFDKPEAAEKACSLLNDPLPEKAVEPPGKFPKGNKTLDRLQKLAPPPPAQDSNQENDPNQDKKESSKTASDPESKKKQKKKSKKNKAQEPSTDKAVAPPAAVTSEQKPEGKKKKKKRKRKTSQSQEQNAGAEGRVAEQNETASADGCSKKGSKKQKMDAAADSKDSKKSKTDPVAGVKEGAGSQAAAQPGEKMREEQAEPVQTKKKTKKKKAKADNAVAKEITLSAEPEGGKSEKTQCATDGAACENAASLPSASGQAAERKLSHKERKQLRQEDIRRKRKLRDEGVQQVDEEKEVKASIKERAESSAEASNHDTVKDGVDNSEVKPQSPQPTSILKQKKAAEKKRVEFNPVPITTEFVEAREARKRKRIKREKYHLRVITKKEWVSLKEEYISQQKSHMQALKESLRELRQQEAAEAGKPWTVPAKPVDLEDVFGTKPFKLSHEMKMANVEKMKFTPNVIVQWWCTHEMHRDKIRTIFKETHGESIAYIDANEEARSGYIRFKDETSAEEFAKMSRNSTSFMARVLPVDQQEEYWEKANRDRLEKLSRKKKEKGSDRLARKVFQRNKATFFNKPSRIVFDEDEDEDNKDKNEQKGDTENKDKEEVQEVQPEGNREHEEPAVEAS